MWQQNLDGPFIRACGVSVSASATMFLLSLLTPFALSLLLCKVGRSVHWLHTSWLGRMKQSDLCER